MQPLHTLSNVRDCTRHAYTYATELMYRPPPRNRALLFTKLMLFTATKIADVSAMPPPVYAMLPVSVTPVTAIREKPSEDTAPPDPSALHAVNIDCVSTAVASRWYTAPPLPMSLSPELVALHPHTKQSHST